MSVVPGGVRLGINYGVGTAPVSGGGGSSALSLVTGGLSGLLGLAGGIWQTQEQEKMAREQMQFQERMSSTAYQRATADMKLAGINPMLAYMQGGASSPGGAQATIPDVVGPAVSSAMQGARLATDVKNVAQSSALMKAQTLETASRADLNRASAKQIGSGWLGRMAGTSAYDEIMKDLKDPGSLFGIEPGSLLDKVRGWIQGSQGPLVPEGQWGAGIPKR